MNKKEPKKRPGNTGGTIIFDETNFVQICNHLAKKDAHLKSIIDTCGHPPIWKRKQRFETLIHIILEQQVSLASANAALKKLKEKIRTVTPVKIMGLTDEELKACYFSRQKIVYARDLASAIIEKRLNLKQLAFAPDEVVRTEMKKVKGIGDWTVDVYLMMALQRTDLFPLGDIALLNSLKELKGLPGNTVKEALLKIADEWRPYRTVAAYLLWHSYLSKRNRK